MGFLAGETLTAARLNRLQPVIYSAGATGTLPVPTTVTDVAGATVTFTTTSVNAIYVVDGSFDISQLATTNNDCFGYLNVDGTDLTKLATLGGQVLGDRATVSQTWHGTLTSSGSHTLKLRANATAASQYQVNPTNTSLIVMIIEVA